MFSVARIRKLFLASQILAASLSAQQYTFHQDSQDEGLGSLTVLVLLQDHRGVLWAGTENGLYQFDGSTYTRVGATQGLLGTTITSLYEDAAGELWVGTTTNIYHGDGTHFSAVAAAPIGLKGSPGQKLNSTGPGHMLAVVHQTLLRLTRTDVGDNWSVEPYFSPAALAAYPQLNTIHSLYVSRNGSMWAGCGDAICQVRGSSVKVWGAKEGVVVDSWLWFLEDSAGRLWARGYHHIRALSSQGAKFADEDIPTLHDTFVSPYVPLVEDPRHRIITRTDQGLAIWNEGQWQIVGPENGLKVPGIASLVVDRNGILWMGTYGKGVERWLGYGDWESWTAGQTPDDNPVVWDMLRDHRGTLWAATESGVVKFDPARKRFVPWQPGANAPRQQVVSVIEARDGSIWFSSSQTLLHRYHPDTGNIESWDMKPTQIRWVREDSSGRLWVLSQSGIFRYDAAANRIVEVHDPALPETIYSDSCDDRSGGLWVATRNGIVHFAGGKWTAMELRGWDAPDGFDTVACSADGTLWLGGSSAGAGSGVAHLRVQGNVASPAEPQAPSMLASEEVVFARFDRRGWLWIGTGSGVYVFNGSRWRHITEKDGLTWNDCAENAFLDDSDGSIWIGTANGLAHLLHPGYLFNDRPLRIISVNATLGEAAIPLAGVASFAWTREPLRVHVASSDFEDQSSTVYRYRLVGLDKDWQTTKSQDLRYSSVPDGDYRLELYAEDLDRAIRSDTMTISFRLRPPWWRSLPFEIVVSALLLALIYIVLRFRERRLVARQAQLEALVGERTADLNLRTEELEQEKLQLLIAREALRKQASRDALTGLLNHGAIHEILFRDMTRAQHNGKAITAVMIDIDHFKRINDAYGHPVGDQVLREVARRLKNAIRPHDAAGRYGGEEFLLILPDFDAGQDGIRMAALHAAICLEPIPISNEPVKVTCSIGVSVFSGNHAMTAAQLVDCADKAMYEAKHAGRNCIRFSTQPEAESK